jgi:hypothetical protein
MLLKDFIRELLAVNIQLSGVDEDIRLDSFGNLFKRITISVRHKDESTTRHDFYKLGEVTEELKNTTFISLQVLINPVKTHESKYKFVVTE